MLFLNSRFLGLPVVSVQTMSRVGVISDAIIDPETLNVVAYKLQGPLVDRQDENILRSDDIREIGTSGIFIDSIDELVSPKDVISLGELMKLNFKLLGHKVVTKKGKKVGKVTDFSFDTVSFSIYQLIVQRPFTKSFNNPELTINRSQIVEIDDSKVVIKNDTETVRIEVKDRPDLANFVNPFRGQTQSQNQKEQLPLPQNKESLAEQDKP